MDRQTLERDLIRADARVRDGERHIINQRAIVTKLEGDGHDAAMARQLLRTLEDLQATRQSDRDRLAREIALEEETLQRAPLRAWANSTPLKKDAPRSS
jgi:hypothetical protein